MLVRAPAGATLIAAWLAACESAPRYVGFDAAPCIPDPTRHDEDGDGFPDSCDRCPIAVDPYQLDTTEEVVGAFPDGVGDVCDLAPGLSGDDLAALHTFADGTKTKWMGSGWSIENDAASATGPAHWVSTDMETGDGLAVRARIATWAPTGTLSVTTDGDGMRQGLVCSLTRDRDGDGTDELDALQITGASATKSVPVLPGDFTLSAVRLIDFERTGRVQCRLDHGTTTTIVEIPTIDDTTTGGYALAATDGAVSVAAVAVYTRPVHPCSEPARCDDATP